jgi:2-furoyl-CoA dehydrogenase FAD binding subunit
VKPAPFRYERAESVEETLALLAEHGSEAKVLAGGQSLVPALNMRLVRPGVLVDINGVFDLDNGESSEDGALLVGATVRQADPRLRRLPLLAECLPHVGHVVTRNRGTVCGSIAHADPAAELPLALVALDGVVVARSMRGERQISAADFFQGHFSNALEPDEIVAGTRWPRLNPGGGWAFEEFAQRHGDFALCTAAAVVHGDDLRVAVGAVVDRPTVLEVDPDDPGSSAAGQVDPFGNLHASAAYQRQLVRTLVDRAVRRARERAREPAREEGQP